MHVVIKWHVDMWQEIKDSALFTIHKHNGKYPTSKWKNDILMAEHSPIRDGRNGVTKSITSSLTDLGTGRKIQL